MTRAELIARLGLPPVWSQCAWTAAKWCGLETLTLDEINAEIVAHRNETRRGAVATTARVSKEEG
jgi:hypothetical protein